MIRFATFSTHKMAQSQMLDAQSRLFDSQMQISSGKVSRNYAGIAIESRRLVNLENAVTGVNGFIRIIDVTESRLQLMENAVVGAFDLASQFRDLLVNALNIDNASLLTLNQRAEDMLQELTGVLNVRQDNRFLFSGSRIGTAPIDISVLLATSGRGILFISIAALLSIIYVPAMLMFHATMIKKPTEPQASDSPAEASFDQVVDAVEGLGREQSDIRDSILQLSSAISEYATHLQSHTAVVRNLAEVTQMLEDAVGRKMELAEPGNAGDADERQ